MPKGGKREGAGRKPGPGPAVMLGVRVPPEVAEAVKADAAAKGLTLSEWIAVAIAAHLRQ